MTTAAGRWRDELAAWAIPEPILAASPESPWSFPVELFRVAARAPDLDTPSRRRALESLPPDGVVLDVGCGGGTAALALVPPAGRLVGVDPSAELLTEFATAAEQAGISHEEVLGMWPEAAGDVPVTDVVVCHHVIYNVPDLAAFAQALTSRARHRVVLELTERHPMTSTSRLWKHFHGLDRPTGPDAGLAAAALAEAGLPANLERFSRPARPVPREVMVAATRRRLCLPTERDAEVDRELGPGLDFGDREMACLWWNA